MDTAITVGNFDGVHLGHVHLVRRLKEEAARRNLKPLVITFDPHPIEVLQPRNRFFCKLSTAGEKVELLRKLGVEVEVLPFTEEFSKIPPERFLREFLLERFKAKLLVVGYDWHFGKDASGDVSLVREFCLKHRCEFAEVEPYTVGGKVVSSSLVRELLKEKRIKEAALYLGHPYWIRRRVEKGTGKGRELGFPTLNFGNVGRLCLPDGVYVVCIDGYPAVANLGYAPTLKGFKRTLEVHVLRDFFKISDRPRIVFKRFIREEVGFKTVEDLIEQIRKDVDFVRKTYYIT